MPEIGFFSVYRIAYIAVAAVKSIAYHRSWVFLFVIIIIIIICLPHSGIYACWVWVSWSDTHLLMVQVCMHAENCVDGKKYLYVTFICLLFLPKIPYQKATIMISLPGLYAPSEVAVKNFSNSVETQPNYFIEVVSIHWKPFHSTQYPYTFFLANCLMMWNCKIGLERSGFVPYVVEFNQWKIKNTRSCVCNFAKLLLLYW